MCSIRVCTCIEAGLLLAAFADGHARRRLALTQLLALLEKHFGNVPERVLRTDATRSFKKPAWGLGDVPPQMRASGAAPQQHTVKASLAHLDLLENSVVDGIFDDRLELVSGQISCHLL